MVAYWPGLECGASRPARLRPLSAAFAERLAFHISVNDSAQLGWRLVRNPPRGAVALLVAGDKFPQREDGGGQSTEPMRKS